MVATGKQIAYIDALLARIAKVGHQDKIDWVKGHYQGFSIREASEWIDMLKSLIRAENFKLVLLGQKQI